MTNHAYFNLNANIHNTPTVLDHIVAMPSAKVRKPSTKNRHILDFVKAFLMTDTVEGFADFRGG